MWRRWRDAILGSPRWRDALARLPIGGAIAERHARRLFAATSGFAQSRMLAAAIELELFDRLAEAPMREEAIAAVADLPVESALALADAMVAMRVWERDRAGTLHLAIDGLVVASDPAIRVMVTHDALLYRDLADPVAMLRARGGGALAAFWPYRGGGDAAGYARLMAASHDFAGAILSQRHDFGRYRAVMDVGGGHPRFLEALAARWPALDLALVDLPPVVAALREARVDPRIALHARVPGEALPGGADAITLIRVLHDLDDRAARALIGHAAAALPKHGALIVAEPMARSGGGGDPVAAYFAAYLGAMGSGRLRTPGEVGALLREAGLTPRRPRRPHLLLGVIEAARALP